MRRAFFAGSVALALLCPWSMAWSQQWPTRPIRMVVPLAAGGAVDITARALANGLAAKLGQPVIVENRSGAAGLVGTENVVRSPADGYSIVMTTTGVVSIAPYLYKSMSFNPIKDMVPITPVANVVSVLVVPTNSSVTSLSKFIDMAKAKPGKLNFGSSGVGAADDMATELFMVMTGTRMTNVPYRGGGPAMVGLVAGDVDFMFSVVAPAMSQIQAGRLRPLGVTSTQRLEALPDVPTIAETGVPGYESITWYGLFAPADTPAAIINRINKETVEVMKDPQVRKQLIDAGLLPHTSSPKEFAEYIASDSKKWGDVVKTNDLKVE